jgi:hypothetical protein
MYLTGSAIRNIPTTQNLSFALNNISLINSSGVVIGFSGQNKNFTVTLTGGKVYDNSGKYVFGYSQPFSLSGNIESGLSQLFIDSVPLTIYSGAADYYNNFYISIKDIGYFSADGYVSIPNLPIAVNVAPVYPVLGSVQIFIKNNSNMPFTIFDYALQFMDVEANLGTPQLSGTISGVINPNATSTFYLQDVAETQANKTLTFNLVLDTNLGQVINEFSTTATSGFNYTTVNFSKLTSNLTVPVLFFGDTGVNTFSFDSNPSSGFVIAGVQKYNTLGEYFDTGYVNYYFQPVFPLNGNGYLSEYPVSVSITNSGLYDTCPQAQFTQYYSVTGFNFLSQTIVATGCSSSVPLKFTSVDGVGTGASGYALINPIEITDSVVYGTIGSPAYYYSVTGYQITNLGTGYTQPPIISLDFSSVPVNCYDFAQSSGNKYPYSAFSGVAILSPLAAYMTGLVLCAQSGSEYVVSGLVFTNQGSGYSSLYPPKVNFIRDSGDTQSQDATGIIYLNQQSENYVFNEVWGLLTGNAPASLSPWALTSGSGILTEDLLFYLTTEDNYGFFLEAPFYTGTLFYSGKTQLNFGIVFNPMDYTGNCLANLTLIADNGSSLVFNVTGSKVYSTSPTILMNDVNYFKNSSSVLNFLNEGLT